MADEKRIARLLMGLGPGDGVLDVACGPGNFSRDFARAVGEDGLVVGVDASRPMLERAVRETRDAGLDNLCFVFARRGRAAVSRRVLRRRLLLRGAEPVPRALQGARRDAPRAVAGRAHRAVHEQPRPHAPVRTLESAIAAPAGIRMFDQDELVDALRERGFTDIRQRLRG